MHIIFRHFLYATIIFQIFYLYYSRLFMIYVLYLAPKSRELVVAWNGEIKFKNNLSTDISRRQGQQILSHKHTCHPLANWWHGHSNHTEMLSEMKKSSLIKTMDIIMVLKCYNSLLHFCFCFFCHMIASFIILKITQIKHLIIISISKVLSPKEHLSGLNIFSIPVCYHSQISHNNELHLISLILNIIFFKY
jgi:hypothetical protein